MPNSRLEGGSDDPLVALGVVARPHGVRGEIRVHLYNAHSSLLDERQDVVLRKGEHEERRAIRSASMSPGAALLRLEGCDTREAADALRGTELCVRRSELPPLEEGEVYHVDLEGLSVVDEAGTALGVVARVLDYPSVTCLEVLAAEETREVPMLDRYVLDVNTSDKTIRVAFWDELAPNPIKKKK